MCRVVSCQRYKAEEEFEVKADNKMNVYVCVREKERVRTRKIEEGKGLKEARQRCKTKRKSISIRDRPKKTQRWTDITGRE